MSQKAFKGLEKVGFDHVNNQIYEKASIKQKENIIKEISEKDLIYEKTYECPVCDTKFKTKIPKVGGQKLLRVEKDLRPVYQVFEPYKYDVIVCNKCGYATLQKEHKKLSDTQIELIRKNISIKYKEVNYGDVYDYDTAITRYKLALLNAVVRRAKSSEKAYICLKIKWLYTSKKETLDIKNKTFKKEYEECLDNEKRFAQHALQGFEEGYFNENKLTSGLDLNTVAYFIAELKSYLGFYKEANKWLSDLIMSRSVTKNLKQKAIDLKNDIKLRDNPKTN